MSYIVSSICADRDIGMASRKQMLMFLADKASDDGSGIWCSKNTIALFTSLSKSTVKRIINDFLKEGILAETGKRPNNHGYTVEYCICLDHVTQLPSVYACVNQRGSIMNSVHDEPQRGVIVNPQEGLSRTPNHPSTILQPPTREREEAVEEVDIEFEKAWLAYPEDRRRNQKSCREAFGSAIKLGASPDSIVRAVLNYQKITDGYTRSKVKFSDNWFKNVDWQQFIVKDAIDEFKTNQAFEASLPKCAEWVRKVDSKCHIISSHQIKAMLGAGMITQTQVILAGLESKI